MENKVPIGSVSQQRHGHSKGSHTEARGWSLSSKGPTAIRPPSCAGGAGQLPIPAGQVAKAIKNTDFRLVIGHFAADTLS